MQQHFYRTGYHLYSRHMHFYEVLLFSSDHSMYITRVINYITTRNYFFLKMFNVREIEVLTKIDFHCNRSYLNTVLSK